MYVGAANAAIFIIIFINFPMIICSPNESVEKVFSESAA